MPLIRRTLVTLSYLLLSLALYESCLLLLKH
jgi:hypothetical protein